MKNPNWPGSECKFHRRLQPAGGYAHHLDDQIGRPHVLRDLMGRATHFGMTHRAVSFYAGQPQLGKRKLGKLRLALRALRTTDLGALRVACATSWPGTEYGKGGVLCVIGPTGALDFETVALGAPVLMAQTEGPWQDLMLVRGDELIYYECSHEGFGTIFADLADMKRMDLPFQPADMALRHAIEAFRLPPETLSSISDA